MAFSVSQSRAEYRRKMAILKADKKAANEQNKNKNNYYKPKAIPLPCRYCKQYGHKVGHFDKELGRFVTTCVKAIEASKRKADYNKRQRQFTSNWKNQVSEAVALETGSSGWDTAGSQDLTTAAIKVDKQVFAVSKNRFALSDDEDDDVEQQKKKARKQAHEARLAAAKVTPLAVPPPPAMDWGPPRPGLGPRQETLSAAPDAAKPELVRAPRKTTTPVNSDSSDDDAPILKRSSGGPPSLPSPHTPPPARWGCDDE